MSRTAPGLAWLLFLTSCSSLWGAFAPLNPSACTNGGNECVPGYVCNQALHQCQPTAPLVTPPRLTAVTPILLPSGSSTPLQIDGENFQIDATVTIDGTVATPLTRESDQRLQTVLPTSTRSYGGIPILVRNPDGGQASRDDLFASYATQPFQTRANNCLGDGVISAVLTVDLNGDGRRDLTLANRASPSSVFVLLGNGSGNFGPPKEFSALGSPDVMAAGDFNSDGATDILIGSRLGRGLRLLLGNNQGDLSSPTTFLTNETIQSLAVADA